MLTKITTTRKVGIALAVFLLFSVLLAFLASGDDVGSQGINEVASETSVETPAASEEMSVNSEIETSQEINSEIETSQEINSEIETSQEINSESNDAVYVNIEGVEEVPVVSEEVSAVPDGSVVEPGKIKLDDSGVYAELDEVIEDNGVEDVARVVDEGVYVNIKDVSKESIEEKGNSEEQGKETEEKEFSQSFTGVVEVAGELERKEIMKVNYLESQSEVVPTIQRKEEVVVQNDEQLKKEIVVSSSDHFDNEIIYRSYFANEVASKDQIKLNWKNEGKEIDFETYDENNNGMIDSISWVIPHLSQQEFEIIVDFTLVEDVNASEISIETISAPSTVSASPVSFDFKVNYNNLSLIACNLTILNNLGEIISEQNIGGNQSYNLDLSNGNYSWNFECLDILNETMKRELGGNFIVNANYIPSAILSAGSQNITKGQIVTFNINVSAPAKSDVNYLLYRLNYGDGGYDTQTYAAQTSIVLTLTHNYTSSGSFTVNLTGSVQYTGDDPNLLYFVSTYKTIVVNEPLVTGDTESPRIRLIEPGDDKSFELESRDQKIKFSYNVTDNVKIANCTFEMFYYNDSLFGEEIIKEVKRDISNGSIISYEYKDFDEGDYSWDVECYDNSSNKGSVSDRDFSVYYPDEESDSDSDSSGSSTEKKTTVLSAEEQTNINEVQSLIDAINDFFIKEEKFDSDQIDAIKDLELDETLKFYKKKLLQSKIDLEHNLDFMREEAQKEARRQEILDEINEMKKNIPTSFEVKGSKDYFKSSLEADVGEVISAYVQTKGIVLDNWGISEMAKQNELLQNQITVSVNTKNVAVRYLDGHDEEFVLVSKKLDFKSKDFDSLIEVVPKEIVDNANSVSFVVTSNVLKQDPILEVKLTDLGEREKLVYKINKVVDLAEIEKTTTLAFKEDIPESTIGGITGFVSLIGVGAGGVGFYLSWILVVIGVLVIGAFSYKRVQINRLKKHKDVKALFMITSETERLLKAMEIDKARAKYHEAQAIYPKIPEKGKKYAYKKIQKLYLAIDRKDITTMVKEFISASKAGRKNDALMLYNNIQKLYPRMPKGFKEKVFEKIQPHLDRLKDFKS